MSFLTRLFGQPKPPDPDLLRQELLATASDPRALERLCRQHRDLIRQHFDAWRTVPAEIRDQPQLVQSYLNGLVAVAETFAHRLGDPGLMQMLLGPQGTNPIDRWRQSLDAVRKLKDDLRYPDAVAQLTDLLIDVRKLKGTAVDAYLPITLGELGECYFQSGDAVKALAPTRQALDLVQRAADHEGIRAYLGNLYEIHRYLDQPDEAANCMAQLADAHDRHGDATEARRCRARADFVRRGEPRNRVVVEINGQLYELDEVLQGIEGGVRFHFARHKLTLRPAETLTQRGNALGSQGQYDEAMSLFRDAARADPCAPEPVHQAAVTLLHLDRPGEAVEDYARVEELAPGWFHCRSELWLAQQMLLNRYDHRTFLLLRIVEDGGLAAQARLRSIQEGLSIAPDLALLHELQGKAFRDAQQPTQALAAFRRGLSCAEEPDIRTRLLVDVAAMLDPGDERRRLLTEAVALGGNLVAQATARIILQFDS